MEDGGIEFVENLTERQKKQLTVALVLTGVIIPLIVIVLMFIFMRANKHIPEPAPKVKTGEFVYFVSFQLRDKTVESLAVTMPREITELEDIREIEKKYGFTIEYYQLLRATKVDGNDRATTESPSEFTAKAMKAVAKNLPNKAKTHNPETATLTATAKGENQ